MTGGVLSPASHVGWAECVIAMWYMYVDSHDRNVLSNLKQGRLLVAFPKLKKNICIM